MNSIELKALLILLSIAAAFLGGWRVSEWHSSAQREAEIKAAMKQQNDNMTTLITAHNKEVAHIDTLNDATTQDQVHTQLLIQAQNDAIAKVQAKLATLHVGSCTLNADADSVLQGAYQAAFPAAPASQTHH